MKRRKGVSLLNVMIFLLFSGMVTAQVFFFTATSIESVSEEREIMQYRMRLDELVEIAKDALKISGDKEISHDNIGGLNFSQFYEGTQAKYKDGHILKKWERPGVTIHDLDYTFDKTFNRDLWIKYEYSGESMDKKVFAAIPPLGPKNASDDLLYATNRFYLIRVSADLPPKFNGRNLMYQVLVSRDELSSPHKVETLSFQEIWYGSD